MNYYEKTGPLEEFKRFFKEGSVLSRLILINAGIWLAIQAMRVLYFLIDRPDHMLTGTILQYFAVPASLPALSSEPWTLITYMFLHIDIWHILFNMLWLYWFGRIFLQYLTSRQLIIVYLLGGIAGGLVYILSFNLFPVFSKSLDVSRALGASASVMAIVTAISFHVPNFTINLFLFGRVRIIYLAIILFIFDFFMIPTGNSCGHIAHIGGALLGFFYAQFLPSKQQTFSRKGWSDQFSEWLNKKRHSKGFKATAGGRPMTDEEYNYRKAENQKRMDAILEKISRGGYDSLTKEEKEFLFKSSNKQ